MSFLYITVLCNQVTWNLKYIFYVTSYKQPFTWLDKLLDTVGNTKSDCYCAAVKYLVLCISLTIPGNWTLVNSKLYDFLYFSSYIWWRKPVVYG